MSVDKNEFDEEHFENNNLQIPVVNPIIDVNDFSNCNCCSEYSICINGKPIICFYNYIKRNFKKIFFFNCLITAPLLISYFLLKK